MSAIIQVKWNGKRFPVEFQSTKELETTSVKDFKLYIQRMTGVNVNTMRLQAFGALMNNNDMPLSIYGLRPGSYVTMKVVKDNHHGNQQENTTKQKHHKQPQQHETTPNKNHEHNKHNNHHKQHHKEDAPQVSNSNTNSEEDELLEQLQVIQDKVEKEVTPQVKKYEKDAKEFLGKSEKVDKDKKKQVYMGAYLGEQLMHVLFDLDSFICGPENLNARQKRKEIVKVAQALLDKVDEIKSVIKNVKVIDEKQD